MTGERREEGAASRVRTTATLRLAFAVAAMLASALWLVSLRGAPDVRFDVARDWAVGHLAALSVLLGLASAGLRSSAPAPWLARVAMPLELGVLLAWAELTGSTSSVVLAIVPLLIVAYRSIGGVRAGRAAWALASAGYLGLAILEARGVIPHAPLFAREGPFAALPPLFAASAAFTLLSFAAALGLGAALATPAMNAVSVEAAPPTREEPAARGERGRHAGRLLEGKLRLGELLGRGGMGEVYAAERISDGAEVAVKLLHTHLTHVSHVLERFWREVKVVSELPPARVATVLDHGSTAEGLHYVVMERLRGEDLSSRLQRMRRMPVADVLLLAEQLAEVLDAAAKLGVVHRDVKPRNIFLCGSEREPLDARLLDFGICRLQDVALGQQALRTASLLGTPGYLAPEQVSETFGEIGPHTDVFALGAVLYRALTGESAFPSRQPAVAAYEALNHHPAPAHELARDLPPDLDRVLILALAKDPRERYANAGELARDLRAAATGALPRATSARADAIAARRSLHESTVTSAA